MEAGGALKALSVFAMRVAYATQPVESGVYSHFRALRERCAACCVEFVGVSAGARASADPTAQREDPCCFWIAPHEIDPKRAAQAFVLWVGDNRIDAVISVGDPVINSALPFLPDNVVCLSRCYHNTAHSYGVSTFGWEFVDHIIATTPRQQEDLRLRGFTGELVKLIPHGVRLESFHGAHRRSGNPIVVGYLGRLDEYQKGILTIAKVAAILSKRQVPFELRVAGSGPDEVALVRALDDAFPGGARALVGPVSPTQVPGFLRSLDIFIFPSRFEGFGIVLIEAMAAGAVPVASRIEGVTDFIIDDGTSGILIPIDDAVAMADAVQALGTDSSSRAAMAIAAVGAARERFNDDDMCEAYLRLLRAPPRYDRKGRPRSWSEFRMNPAFRRTLGSYLPRAVKATLRRLAELRRLSQYGKTTR